MLKSHLANHYTKIMFPAFFFSLLKSKSVEKMTAFSSACKLCPSLIGT